MIKLFLFAALVVGATATAVEDRESRMIQYKNGWPGVASLRIYPTFVHRCSVTQISNKFFITTARCVSGFEKKVSSMRLVVNSTHLHPDKDSKFLEVKQVFINPVYVQHPVHYNFDYNFALLLVSNYDVKLENPDLQISKDVDLKGYIFFWRFNKRLKDYKLTKIPGLGVLRQPCSEILHRDIGPTFFCVKLDRSKKTGPMDEGTPAITHLGVLGGLYGEHKSKGATRVLVYYNIYSVSAWIQEILSKFHEDYDSRGRRVSCRVRIKLD